MKHASHRYTVWCYKTKEKTKDTKDTILQTEKPSYSTGESQISTDSTGQSITSSYSTKQS